MGRERRPQHDHEHRAEDTPRASDDEAHDEVNARGPDPIFAARVWGAFDLGSSPQRGTAERKGPEAGRNRALSRTDLLSLHGIGNGADRDDAVADIAAYARGGATSDDERAAETTPAADHVEKRPALAMPGSAQEHAQWTTAGETAARDLDEIEFALTPAYRAAVDALDAEMTAEIAGKILSVMRGVERVAEHVEALAQQPPAVSAPGDRGDASSATLEHVRLQHIHGMLSTRRGEITQLLARSIGPTRFRGQPILGGAQHVPLGTRPSVALQAEAMTMVALVSTAQSILRLVPGAAPGACPAVPKSTQTVIAHELGPWRGRPINFAFLRHVLTVYGIWAQLDEAREILGMSVADMEAAVDERTGADAFLDVGTFDEKEVAGLLDLGPLGNVAENHPGLRSRVTTGKAKQVAAQLMTASPEGRAHLVLQLHDQGQLDVFGRKLPWTTLEHIAHSIKASRNGPEARRALDLLAPYYVGHGGEGRLSPKEALLEREAANERDGDVLGATASKVVRHGANLVTAGGFNEASDAYAAHRDGLISDEEYNELWSGAVGKSALSLGGGALGYGLGAAAGRQLALRFGTPMVLGEGLLGGAASGLGGHFAGDLTAQAQGQKDGFDSAGDYALSAGLGGAIGGATAGLSMVASRFLPRGSGSAAQEIAARHPQAGPLLERLRATQGGRAKVRLLVEELLGGDDWGLWPPGSGGAAVATAEAAAGARLRPSDRVLIEVEVDPRLNAPSGGAGPPERPVTILHAERVPEDDNLFDPHPYWDEVEPPRPRGKAKEDLVEHGDDLNVVDETPEHASRLPDEYSDLLDHPGTGVLDASRLGITRAQRHHVLPQEEIEFFQQRGFHGREIDAFCVELAPLDHEMAHGGNQALARKHWPEREWNTAIMRALRREEAKLNRKLTRDQIMTLVKKQMVDFEIDLPFVHYEAP